MTDRELKWLFDNLRRHFDVTAERFDARLGLVAESVLKLGQRLSRVEVRLESLEEKVELTAAETQGMIRNLDHRVAALEQRGIN